MKVRSMNWQLWSGFLLSLIAFVSYPFVFVRVPVTRDFPWVNVLLLGVSAALLLAGLRRSFGAGATRKSKITGAVAAVVAASGIRVGIVNVSGVGSTLAITTIEFEPGCVADLKRALEKVAPSDTNYAHNARWGDENGYAHLRSALIGTAKSYPVTGGRLHIGTWQQIVVVDFDTRARTRDLVLQVIGE